jgi:hypothetical protein
MKVFLSLIGNKYFLWTVIVLGTLGIFKLNSCMKSDYEQSLETYKRQLAGQLSDKERDLQALHAELGIAHSELVSKEELAKRLEKEKNEIDKKFQEFVKQHDLEIASKDETIAKLNQIITGGSSGTSILGCDTLKESIKKCTIAYNWEDPLKRFKLKDPNIFELNNEIFSSEQIFKVYGEIWQQKDGSLKTRRMVLREVQKLGDGTYKDIEGAKAEIVDSNFVYQNEPSNIHNATWKDLFRLRVIASADIHIYPNPGQTNLGLGVEFFNYKGFGINTHTAFNFKDILMSEPRLGVAYNPHIFDTELNLAAGISVGSPFAKFLKDYSATFDLIFYINN